jgi:hypothetical protein
MAKMRTPDKLDRESKMATDAGMSYGKWKALHPDIYVAVDLDSPPDPRERKCLYCGNPFLSFRNKKYCDIYCQQRAGAERGNQKAKERRAAKREQAQNDRHEQAVYP